jgi:hypothetical protein
LKNCPFSNNICNVGKEDKLPCGLEYNKECLIEKIWYELYRIAESLEIISRKG